MTSGNPERRLILSDTGTILHPRQKQPIQDWVRQHAAEGLSEINIDLAQVPSASSDVLVALSLAARQATTLGVTIVLVNANRQIRVALSQLGITELGVRIAEAPPPPLVPPPPPAPVPERPTRESTTSARRRAAPGPSRPVILVVDDDPINRRVAAQMLAMMGCDACQAANGAAAIEVCRTRSIDLVLMDVAMPVMDGYEASRHIRAGERLHGRRMPILGLSAHTGDEDRRDGLAAGMDEYLAKPINSRQLSLVLQRYLPGRVREIAEQDDVVG